MFLRDATVSDVPEIVALVESAYRGDSSRAGWTSEADYMDGRRTGADEVSRIVSGPGVLMLAYDGEDLIGCCHLEMVGDAAYFGMFAVRPTLQGGGLGSQLLGAAEERARTAWTAPAMEMTVINRREELIAYYERKGYVRTGATKPFPYGDDRFGKPRVDDLTFVVLRKVF